MLIVANMLAGLQPNGQLNLGAQIADWSGLRGVEAFKAELACASGGSAFRVPPGWRSAPGWSTAPWWSALRR